MVLSSYMFRLLKNLREGRSPGYGLSGRSQHGGMCNTLVAAHKRGFIAGPAHECPQITVLGAHVLEEEEVREAGLLDKAVKSALAAVGSRP